MFTIDRIIRNFRARSQLLLAHLEDNDEVLTHRFADDDGFCDEKENKFNILNKKWAICNQISLFNLAPSLLAYQYRQWKYWCIYASVVAKEFI